MKLRSLLVGGVAVLALVGCNTTAPMTVKRVELQAAPSVTPDELEPIIFVRGTAGMRFGTVIGHLPGTMGGIAVDGQGCNLKVGSPAHLEWSSTSRELSGWADELGRVFVTVRSDRGFNLAGNPDQLFDSARDTNTARYHIGARIEEVASNFCLAHSLWDGRPLGLFSGEMYMRVQWEIYDPLQQTSVASFETEGYRLNPRSSTNGVIDTFLGAFGAAAEGLAANPRFQEVLRKGQGVSIRQVAAPVGDTFSIPTVKKSDGNISDRVDRIVNAVVVLRGPTGHGSGFIITRDGLVMTNAHVVGDRDTMVVRLSSGVELEGKVLRRNQARDVALVKLPIGHPDPLPLDLRDARVPERVYAVGAPLSQSLQSTVSSGVVSAVRYTNEAGYLDIQADVDIHGGNSGGPLLDERGNVIGVAYAGIGGATTSVGLNLFIPIDQALESVNIRLGPTID